MQYKENLIHLSAHDCMYRNVNRIYSQRQHAVSMSERQKANKKKTKIKAKKISEPFETCTCDMFVCILFVLNSRLRDDFLNKNNFYRFFPFCHLCAIQGSKEKTLKEITTKNNIEIKKKHQIISGNLIHLPKKQSTKKAENWNKNGEREKVNRRRRKIRRHV